MKEKKDKTLRRRSSYREQIYNTIRMDRWHPTAMEIYELIKSRNPSLTLGNVYRNLDILVEQGLLSTRDFGDGAVRFDAVTANHYHFTCQECGKTVDMEYPVNKDLEEKVRKETGLKISGHNVIFYGICPECAAKIVQN